MAKPEPLKYALVASRSDRPSPRRRLVAAVAGVRTRVARFGSTAVAPKRTQFRRPASVGQHRRSDLTPLRILVPQLNPSYWRALSSRRRSIR